MDLASSQPILVVGAVLLHFVWQGAIVGLVAALALGLVPTSAARVRYTIACLSLLGLMMAPVGTAVTAFDTTGAEAVAWFSMGTVETVEATTAAWSAAALGAWLPVFVGIWALGVLLQSARLAGAWWRTERVRRADVREPDGVVAAVFERTRAGLGLRRAVLLFESPWIDTPTVIGWLRPTVLLPIGAFTGLSMQQVEAVLAHELAHIRRHDYVINGLQHLAEAVFFYHPAVWWLSRQIRIEREHCCDDVAVEACGDAVTYARALTVLEEARHDRPGFALAATGGSLIGRVRRLVGRPQHEGRPAFSVLAGIAIVLVVAGVASARAYQRPVQGLQGEAEPAGSTLSETIHVALPQAPGRDVTPTAPPPPPPPPPGSNADQERPPLRVGGVIKEPNKVHHVNPIYPEAAREAGVSGVVILEAMIEADGSVSNLKVLRSIPELDQAAINAVRQWRYTPTLLNGQPVRVVMTVTVNFTLRARGAQPDERAEAVRVDGLRNRVSGRPAADPVEIPRVGGEVRAPVKVRNVNPAYPRDAMDANVSGVVIMEATLDVEGNVTDVQVVRSVPMLDQAAIDAVRQWKYAPAVVNGQPSPVVMTVTVNFSLN